MRGEGNIFIYGIGCSILSQQLVKELLAEQWGMSDVMGVTAVAAALGMGCLNSLPFFPGICVETSMSYLMLPLVCGIVIVVLGVLVIFAPLPKVERSGECRPDPDRIYMYSNNPVLAELCADIRYGCRGNSI